MGGMVFLVACTCILLESLVRSFNMCNNLSCLCTRAPSQPPQNNMINPPAPPLLFLASATRPLHTGRKEAMKKPDMARRKTMGTMLGTKDKTMMATAS